MGNKAGKTYYRNQNNNSVNHAADCNCRSCGVVVDGAADLAEDHPRQRCRRRDFDQIDSTDRSTDDRFKINSFASIASRQSNYSVSRPWSRVSRRRWKESTLTLPYESSKTAWPVTQLESTFLPEFPVNANNINEKRFDYLTEINQGAFGKVFKVYDNQLNRIVALKVLSKSRIIKENFVQQVKDEVQIQRVCGHHSFIVNCSFHWQNRKRLYIVSDYVDGGELSQLLNTYLVLPFVLVQLYVAQLALALDFLHNAGIIYRDLKPENILLDTNGHIQLIDFGLSKWLSYGNKTRTICGTLRYMAPELFAFEPYGHAVDWWSLGVIACLMLTGKYPNTTVVVQSSILPNNVSSNTAEHFRNNLSEPQTMVVDLPNNFELDMASKDLLLRLLEVLPAKRLRSLRTLQTIAFYKGYNFEDVMEKKQNPRDLLLSYFPNGPPATLDDDQFQLEGFDLNHI